MEEDGGVNVLVGDGRGPSWEQTRMAFNEGEAAAMTKEVSVVFRGAGEAEQPTDEGVADPKER